MRGLVLVDGGKAQLVPSDPCGIVWVAADAQVTVAISQSHFHGRAAVTIFSVTNRVFFPNEL